MLWLEWCGEGKSCSFLKEKPKNFYTLVFRGCIRVAFMDGSLFASFYSEKEDSCCATS
jgi:hypothetical protein